MTRILIATAAVLALGTSAFAANSITTKGLTASGSSVSVPDVKADQDGYLVIHAVKNGKVQAPESIGHAMIKKGDNKDVAVTLDQPLEGGMSYVAMLHKETNNNGKYDFGPGMTKTDTPVMANGKAVTKKFTLSAADASMNPGTSMKSDSMDKGAMKSESKMKSGSMDKGTMEKGAMDNGAMKSGDMKKKSGSAM